MASSSGHLVPTLCGREAECRRLDLLLEELRAGKSAALVLRGAAGIGKTALLDYLAAHSGGCQVLRASGVESEMELPFAGLHQLCARLLDRRDRLIPAQRETLETALAMGSSGRPDRFL